jgi:hypothetical protein
MYDGMEVEHHFNLGTRWMGTASLTHWPPHSRANIPTERDVDRIQSLSGRIEKEEK